MTDIAINTTDLSRQIVLELGKEDNFMYDNIKSQAFPEPEQFEGTNLLQNIDIQIPVLDRFLNLLITLYKPDAIKDNEHLTNSFLTELGLAFEVTDESRAIAFKLISDSEYLLKY